MYRRSAAMLSDEDMIRRIMEGDRHAAAWLIQSTERLVTGIVFKMVNDHAERKDVMQDIYLKTFKYIPKFRFQCKLSTWVAQICYTTCADYLKRKKKLITIPEEEDVVDMSQQLFAKEKSEILDYLSNKLPPVYRTLITLFHKNELSIEEIMKITGLPAGTIKSYLFRARKMLKDRLLDYYSKEDL